MSVDSAFMRLREANPVPDPSLLTDQVDVDALLFESPQRSEAMLTQEIETKAPERKSRRTGLIAVVTALGVALVVVLGFLLPGSEVAEPTPGEVVAAAYEAWGNADSDVFFGLIADDAVWYGQPVDAPAGETALNMSWGVNTTRGVTFSEFECAANGDIDPQTGGEIVECAGTMFDEIHLAFDEPPSPFTASYAVADGQVVNAIAFQQERPEWANFVDQWIRMNYGDDIFSFCDGPDASGEACANVFLSNVDEAKAAWEAEQG